MRNLFIVGGQRCGTSYLYEVLRRHPEVTMAGPLKPEPKFFLNKKSVMRGREYYEWKYFSNASENSAVFGEKSTSYFESVDAARAIKSFYPDASILIILRDPVLRAYSNYKFSVNNNLEKLSFPNALAAEAERTNWGVAKCSVSPYAYAKRGYYFDYLRSYLQVFEENQLRVLILEDLAGSRKEISDLYSWLGICPEYVPPKIDTKVNLSTANMSADVETLRRLGCKYKDSVRKLEDFLGRKLAAWEWVNEVDPGSGGGEK